MAILAGIIGGFLAMFGVILVFLIPIELLGLSQYKGPGSHAIVYAIVGASLGAFFAASTGIKNWVQRKRKSRRASEASPDEPAPPKEKTSSGQGSQKPYDSEKWNALLKYDEDIARVAEQLRSFGDKWVDVFARDFLALNDKQYLPSIVQKIIFDAKKEREELRAQHRAEEQKEKPEESKGEQQQAPAIEKNKPRSNYAFTIITICCVGLLAALGGIELNKTWSFHEKLLIAQAEIRKQLPIKYKNYISLVDMRVGYLGVTYMNSVADEALPQFKAELSALKKDVRKGICGSEDMKGMLSTGVSYSYEYRDTSDVVIAKFEVDSCP
jgi:hypothetical protein